MSKHTPGKWIMTSAGIRNQDGYICFFRDKPTHWTGQDKRYADELEEQAFFARLLFAAPEMLEALKIAVTMFPGVPYPDERKVLENITALLARIEGEK